MPKNNILSQIPIDLGDNLKLRFATPDDIDMLVEFNARLHEAVNAGPSVRDLMSGDHPTCKASDFTVVEDTKTGKNCVIRLSDFTDMDLWGYPIQVRATRICRD